MNKNTYTGSGRVANVYEHLELEKTNTVVDLRQADVLLGDVTDVVNYARRRHPHNPIVVIHGCNCFNTMGAGLAKVIAKQWPEADAIDKTTKKGDKSKLGNYSFANVDGRLVIVNLYTQYHYGAGLQLSYDALEAGLIMVVHQSNELYHSPIYLIPKYIGCGYAGGDYNIVKDIVSRVMDGEDYYLFDNK